jgi:hypothetical protein
MLGDEEYNPIVPWVSKVRPDGRIASGLPIYVDDCQITAALRQKKRREFRYDPQGQQCACTCLETRPDPVLACPCG